MVDLLKGNFKKKGENKSLVVRVAVSEDSEWVSR